jgi:hypothetical protein
MIKKFESFEFDDLDFLKEMVMDLDEEDYEEDEGEEEDGEEDEDFVDDEDFEDDDDDEVQRKLMDYDMNEKTINHLLKKCEKFPFVKKTKLVYLSCGTEHDYYIIRYPYSEKLGHYDYELPVLFLEFHVDIFFEDNQLDKGIYSMFLWTEFDNNVAYILRKNSDIYTRVEHIDLRYGYIKKIIRTPMEDFFKMLKNGPTFK